MRRISGWFSAFLIFMGTSGCFHAGFPSETKESAWYKMQLLDAQLYNSKFAHQENHDRKEIWVVEIESVEGRQIVAASRECLYAYNRFGPGYCTGGDERFLLKTYFLKTPLKKGDIIIFSAFHRNDRGGTLHLIEGSAIAKVDRKTGEPTPLEYDQANCPD